MPLLAGFATTIAMIAAIGAQNAFVLRQGLRREQSQKLAETVP